MGLLPSFSDFWDAMDPSRNNGDPLTAALGNAAGFNNTFLTMTPGGVRPWDAWKGVKSDWTKFKHLFPDIRKDREVLTNGSTTSRRLIYGKARVSGQLVYAESSANSQILHLIVVLAGHPCTLATRTEPTVIAGHYESGGLDEFGDPLPAVWVPDAPGPDIEVPDLWLDDKKLEDAAFTGLVSYTFHDGTQVAADAGLVAASAGLWTTEHKLLGCTYVYVKLTYGVNAFPSGIPTIKAVLNGFEVYDPRDESTAWSENPALCLRHYMLYPSELGGMGCDTSEVNGASVIAAANICDEMVAKDQIGGTEKRYTCNGIVTIEQTPAAILDRLTASMNGKRDYLQGQWRIYAGAYSEPVAHLDESYLNGGMSFALGNGKNNLLNLVKGSFVDPANNWAVNDFPPVTIGAYVTADDEELPGDIQLDFTTSPSTAQRIGKFTLERSRRGTTVEYPCKPKALALKLSYNDVVTLSNDLMGWDHRIFRVVDCQYGVTGGPKYTLEEESPDIYDWVPGDITPIVPPPATNLPDPWTVAAPTSLDITEELYVTNVASIVKCRAIFTWTGIGQNVRYEVAVDGTVILETVDTKYIFDDIAPGTYAFTVRAVRSGIKSADATISATIDGKTVIPDEVDSLTVTTLDDGTRSIAWAMASPPLDLAGFRIRYIAGDTGTWGSMTPLHTGLQLASPFETGQLTRGEYTFAIVTEDTSGNLSDAVMTTVTLGRSPGERTPTTSDFYEENGLTDPDEDFGYVGITISNPYVLPAHMAMTGSFYVAEKNAVDCIVIIYRGLPSPGNEIYTGPAVPITTDFQQISYSYTDVPVADNAGLYTVKVTSTAGTLDPFYLRNCAMQLTLYPE